MEKNQTKTGSLKRSITALDYPREKKREDTNYQYRESDGTVIQILKILKGDYT